MMLNKGVSTSLFQKPYAFHAVNLRLEVNLNMDRERFEVTYKNMIVS